MGFFQLFRTTYLKTVHMQKIDSLEYKTTEMWALKFKSLHIKLSYLVLVPAVRIQ